MKRAVVLARGQFQSGHGKTAHGLILHGRKFCIVAIIDESCAGRDAGEVMGIGHRGIPIVSSLSGVPGIPPLEHGSLVGKRAKRSASDGRRNAPDTLIIGVAPAGGHLPPAWRQDIREALHRRMNLVSGLHDFLGDDPEFSELAQKAGARIWDVRRPPKRPVLLKGLPSPVPVVLTSGTDASVGKRTVTIELHRAARQRGIDAAYIATGQTGIMVGADAGAAIDHVPGDFMSGAVEDMVQRMVRRGKELIFVQGQASLTHLAYGPVALGILLGCRPHYVVMVHVPGRRFRPSFPDQPVNEPMDEYRLVRQFSGAEAVGIALNCRECPDPASACRYYEDASGLPAVDVLQDGPGRLLDSLLLRLKDDGRFHLGKGIRNAISMLGRDRP